MAYKKLFEPGRIGGLTIRNRAVMSPMGTDLADIRGNATPRLIAYYTERAKGGIGLIINEYTGVDDVDSIPTQHNLRMAQDYNVQEAEELTRSVHAYGAKIFAQLHHGGATSKSAFTGRQNLSPSGVPMAPGGEVPREMTLEDIKRVQEKFIAAAIRCKKAGYDGVELHGAHSYLIAQFFSKYYNRRTDAYGGSLENRCRFIDEIIAGITWRPRASTASTFPMAAPGTATPTASPSPTPPAGRSTWPRPSRRRCPSPSSPPTPSRTRISPNLCWRRASATSWPWAAASSRTRSS